MEIFKYKSPFLLDMYNIYIILVLVSLSNNLFSQINNKLFDKKQIICIGEYHLYTKNVEIQMSIIDSIIYKSNFKSKIIFIEASPELEYFFNLNKQVVLREYLLYNTDRHFSDTSLTKINKLKLKLYNEILYLIRKNTDISVRCYDTHKNIRPIYYTLKYILNRNKRSILYDKFFNKIDSVLRKDNYNKADTLLFYKIKQEFYKENQTLKINFKDIDLYYIEKIFNTPFLYNIDNKREDYLFSQISNNLKKTEQVICIVGNYHIRDNNKKNLRAKLENKYNTVFRRKTLFIGILTKDVLDIEKSKKDFDIWIMNKNGENIFKQSP